MLGTLPTRGVIVPTPTALLFGGATSDRVSVAAATSINDLSAWTAVAWINVDTLTASRSIISKHNGVSLGWFVRLSGTAGELQIVWNRATTNLAYTTNTTPLATPGRWIFLAATLNKSGSAGALVSVATGTPWSPCVAATFGTATDGAGSYNTDAAQALQWGNRAANNDAFTGRIASGQLYSGALTLAECELLRKEEMVRPDLCVGAWHLGADGLSVIDASPYRNHGTVSGPKVTVGPWPRVALSA